MADAKYKVPDVIVGLGAAGRIVVETLLEDPKLRAKVEREIGKIGKRVGKSSFAVTDVATAINTFKTLGTIVEKLHITGDALGWFNRAGAQPKNGKPSPYEVLGLAVTASPELVKIAYRHLVTIHHPDKGGDVKRMAEINAAYSEIAKSWPR